MCIEFCINGVYNQGGDTSEQCWCLLICMSQPSVRLTCPAWDIFQNEKCHLLIEHETQKLKALDESHNQNLKEWRDKLRPRKKVTVSGLVGPRWALLHCTTVSAQDAGGNTDTGKIQTWGFYFKDWLTRWLGLVSLKPAGQTAEPGESRCCGPGHRGAQRPGPLCSGASGLPLKACTHITAGKLLYAESTELHVHHI